MTSTKSSLEEYFEKRKIPSELVGAVIRAREASEAQKKFREELNRYLDKCQREKLRPKSQWIELLQWLSGGKEMINILDALQIHPSKESCLKIFDSLKAHGFPDYFLNNLISEIPSEFLSDEAKDYLRRWLRLNLPQRKIQ